MKNKLPLTNIELFTETSANEFMVFYTAILSDNKNITFEQFESNTYNRGFYHYLHNSISYHEGIEIVIKNETDYELLPEIIYNRVLK